MNSRFMPSIRVRRLLRHDIANVFELYGALSYDAPWASATGLKEILQWGELWGASTTGGIALCGGICPIDANAQFAKAMSEAIALPKNAILLLPLSGNSKYANKFLEILLARVYQINSQAIPILAIPIKTGTEFVPACFSSNFVMVAVRPLTNLRPYYIFLQKMHMQTKQDNSIIVPIQDTLSLSRRLEQGYCGTDLQGFEIRMELKNNEDSYFG